MRATSRLSKVSLTTVLKLLGDAGEVCLDLHDELVRNVKCQRIECDELAHFIHTRPKNLPKAKTKNAEAGALWTWLAIDADSKLIVSYLAGQRSNISAEVFAADLASRVADRVQVTSDGFPAYAGSLKKAFNGAVDHAMLIKVYANVSAPGETRYAPLEVIKVKKRRVSGKPNLSTAGTSYVERMNLSVRMQMRRYTWLTNAHSKTYANHVYALAVYFQFYNFARVNQALGGRTPAMAAGIADHVWSMEEIVVRMEALAPKPGPKGPRRRLAR